jgi:hypothetical protein
MRAEETFPPLLKLIIDNKVIYRFLAQTAAFAG